MQIREPESMEELVYFTKRQLGEKGYAKAWVFREQCPKCKKALMGKPVEKGAVKIRASEYVCPACKYAMPKQAYEETLTANISYSCQYCQKTGQTQIPFKRKKVHGVDALVFHCTFCNQKMLITKKMKETKDKKSLKGMDFDEL
ncbi:MAG: hypothetical protein QW594_04265 [Candidatus Woesearchaeota archaeon]